VTSQYGERKELMVQELGRGDGATNSCGARVSVVWFVTEDGDEVTFGQVQNRSSEMSFLVQWGSTSIYAVAENSRLH